MKRTALRRKPKNRNRPRVSDREREALEDLLRRDFHDAAGKQKRCAACGKRASFQAHHVLYRQHLRAEGLPQWDVRGALRVCDEIAGNCHARHHNRREPIALTKLTDENIAYAFEVLGAGAYDYLRLRYAGDDPRLESHLARR